MILSHRLICGCTLRKIWSCARCALVSAELQVGDASPILLLFFIDEETFLQLVTACMILGVVEEFVSLPRLGNSNDRQKRQRLTLGLMKEKPISVIQACDACSFLTL